MAEMIADRRDIDFVLYEQLDAEKILKAFPESSLNRKTADLVIKEARNLAVKEILPTYAEGDRQGVAFANGRVSVPECFRRVHTLLSQGEWGALTASPEYGGQGLPHIIAQAAFEYLIGANYTLMTYVILGHGAGKMIDLFGTATQKRLFLKNLYTLKWGGSMLLTEPQAGSDLGALTTSAIKNDDGTYSITGNKIFITNGEQNLTENIIHPVLARIEGAPAGTRGISIFIVPKIWVNDDGSLGGDNDVVCTGVEKKMGLHGSPTCSLSLGSRGRCRGLLLGRENQGMAVMFHMMNEVRLEVGTQAFTHASCAYLHALAYAMERRQGRAVEAGADPGAPQVRIISHPDVRRMLLKMKAYVEGMRSLTYYTAACIDKSHCESSGELKEKFAGLTEILTPVVKAYCSERGFDVCVEAMQVFGGYGYTMEFPVEQIVRDCKIATIYEGSNGIQAMDFLGRKLTMKNGALLQALVSEIQGCILSARKLDTLIPLCDAVEAAVNKLHIACTKTAAATRSTDFRSAFAMAHPLLEATGDVVMAWMLLWRASVALPRLEALSAGAPDKDTLVATNKTAAFFHGKIMTARFFIDSILPATCGKLDAIMTGNSAAASIHENSF
ncbi:MAG: acyl-CoA dehydrogenase [Pseudomonadota bacterium]